jgi:DNA polymerase-3 subunit gamma/tau
VKHKSKVAGIYMEGVQVASLEGTVLTLAFTSENNRKAFSGRDALVREVLQERFGVDWRIDAVPASRVGSAPTQAPAPAIRPGPAGATSAPGPSRATSPAPAASPPRTAPPPRVSQPATQPATQPPEPPELPPLPPPPVEESEEVDPDGDADAGAAESMSGMVLIQRELGGQIIKEIDNT